MRRTKQDIRDSIKRFLEDPEVYSNGSLFIADIHRHLRIPLTTLKRHIVYMIEHSLLDPRIVYNDRGRFTSIFFRHYLPEIKEQPEKVEMR